MESGVTVVFDQARSKIRFISLISRFIIVVFVMYFINKLYISIN